MRPKGDGSVRREPSRISISKAEPKFTAAIDNDQIFRRLILDEVRAGRLTAARRRRIVRYAAGLRISAVEVGRMVAECQSEVLSSRNPIARRHALRLVEEECSPWPRVPTVLLVVLGTLICLLAIRPMW